MLRGPEHVNKVLQASTQLTSDASNVEVAGKLLGSSRNILSFYAGEDGNEAGKEAITHARVTVPQKHLTGTSLTAINNVYISILSSNLNDKMFQVGSWTQVEDSMSFLQQVITRCSMTTLFGSAIFKQYPNIIKDYQKFSETVESFSPGMPRFILPATYEQPRNRLLQGIEKWLRVNHSGSEFAKIGDEDPVWDEYKGSKYIQERDNLFAKIDGVDLKDRAAEILGVMFAYV